MLRHRRCETIMLVAAAILQQWIVADAGADTAPVVNDDRAKPLKLVLTRPSYRNTIFASLPVAKIKVEAYPSMHINPGLIVDSTLQLQVLDAQGKVFASRTRTNEGLRFLIRTEVDVSQLPPGDFRLEARLIDSAGNLIKSVSGIECVDSLPLHKLKPAPHEVAFDGRGICHVDGEPFFPIGIFHIWPNIFNYMNSLRAESQLEPLTWEGWYQKLKDAGFNSFQDWQGGREPDELRARYDVAERLGFRGQVHPNSDRDIETLAGHGGVLGWYTMDEPMLQPNTTTQKLADMYEHLKTLDPHHPQFICDNQPSSLSTIAPYVDAIMHDLYPQRDGDMRIVGRATLHARKLKNGRAPVWPVIQAFQLSRYAKKADGSTYSFGRLTEDEMRVTVFDSIACGATGIYYYAYYTSEGPQDLPGGGTRKDYMVEDFPDQWNAMTRINHELARIVPAILSGRTIGTSVEPAESDVHAATFMDGGRAIVVVANPTRTHLCVRIGVPGIGDEGRDLFSAKTVAGRRGWLNVHLEALGAHAFVLEMP